MSAALALCVSCRRRDCTAAQIDPRVCRECAGEAAPRSRSRGDTDEVVDRPDGDRAEGGIARRRGRSPEDE